MSVTTPPPPQANEPGDDRAPQRPPRVVLVDDEPYILEALQRQLRREPWEVRPFNDPLKALESFFQDGEFALIVSDNMMPGLRGLELLARAKEFAPRARRVLLTGHTELNDAISAFNDGLIHRFVNKPWEPADLIQVLREELAIHEREVRSTQTRTEAEGAVRETRTRLSQTVQELKQALTQVALYEDSTRTRRLRVTPQMRRLSFLVVDHNPSVRRLLVSTLQKAGILGVAAVGSAEEALNHLRAVAPVDVVLSEWSLPSQDGMALFEALRAGQTPSAKALFILMTARENRKAVEFALKAGVDYYLIKPFHLDTLLEQIDRLLRKTRAEGQDLRIAKLRDLHFVISNIDQDSRYKIQQMLLMNGIQTVTLADTGEKALRVVAERRADVLILDCNLHDVYWPDLRPRLRDLCGDHRIPSVVVTSVSPLRGEVEKMAEAGLGAYLPGPLRQRELFDTIFNALQADDRYDVLEVEEE